MSIRPSGGKRGAGARGSATLEMLIWLPVLLFLLFMPVETWMVIAKRQYADHVLNTYLTRAQIQGGIDGNMVNEIKNNLTQKGYTNVVVEGDTDVGRGQPIHLTIKYELGPALESYRFIGDTPPADNTVIEVSGVAASEVP
ncbi:MAG: hypothetical protein PWP70_32 [Moorella sp. (in: firmicutes)]|nr:hypothetical protein [Moorella sp. (in: firmicutes)]